MYRILMNTTWHFVFNYVSFTPRNYQFFLGFVYIQRFCTATSTHPTEVSATFRPLWGRRTMAQLYPGRCEVTVTASGGTPFLRWLLLPCFEKPTAGLTFSLKSIPWSRNSFSAMYITHAVWMINMFVMFIQIMHYSDPVHQRFVDSWRFMYTNIHPPQKTIDTSAKLHGDICHIQVAPAVARVSLAIACPRMCS